MSGSAPFQLSDTAHEMTVRLFFSPVCMCCHMVIKNLYVFPVMCWNTEMEQNLLYVLPEPQVSVEKTELNLI